MGVFNGIRYNLKGLWMGLKTPKLLALGLFRFAMVVVITVFAAGVLMLHYQDILSLVWIKPESVWIIWLWHVVSWLLLLFLFVLAAMFSYLVCQLLFSVFVMDLMSRITEKTITGREHKPPDMSLARYFLFLIWQEIPRAVFPLLLLLLFALLGWLTPLGPLLTVISTGVSAIFLAWDNTDLVFARQLVPFRKRFSYLIKNLMFHLGFGIWFLVPGLNILMLSFAPVGAALYQFERQVTENRSDVSGKTKTTGNIIL